MMKFRKKPIVIDGVQWIGKNFKELVKFGAPIEYAPTPPDALGSNLFVGTLEDGEMKDGGKQVRHVASVGDWILKGVKGEFYPCKPDIFEATYEKVEGGE